MRRLGVYATLLMVILLATNTLAQPEPRTDPPVGDDVSVEVIVDGLDRPIKVVNAGDGSNRLFVILQGGQILILKDGELLDTPFLDVTDLVSELEAYSEQGLLGLVFHPNYAENGRFFISYTRRADDSFTMAEYGVSDDNPDVADPDSGLVRMNIPHPSQDHNGGQLLFGLDGYLYIGVGDGGGFGDPENNGQNRMTLLGSILRVTIDTESSAYGLLRDNPFVESRSGANEIWHYGLRNPSSFTLDRETGNWFIADVGQDTWEEVSFIPADHPGGANFGWNRYEGMVIYNEENPELDDMVMPAVHYEHSEERCAVISGPVYRGQEIPDLQGIYLYADWCSGEVYYLYHDGTAWQTDVYVRSLVNITGMGEDEQNEVYMTWYDLETLQGGVLQLVDDE